MAISITPENHEAEIKSQANPVVLISMQHGADHVNK